MNGGSYEGDTCITRMLNHSLHPHVSPSLHSPTGWLNRKLIIWPCGRLNKKILMEQDKGQNIRGIEFMQDDFMQDRLSVEPVCCVCYSWCSLACVLCGLASSSLCCQCVLAFEIDPKNKCCYGFMAHNSNKNILNIYANLRLV